MFCCMARICRIYYGMCVVLTENIDVHNLACVLLYSKICDFSCGICVDMQQTFVIHNVSCMWLRRTISCT